MNAGLAVRSHVGRENDPEDVCIPKWRRCIRHDIVIFGTASAQDDHPTPKGVSHA
jgi:hypothetical protein